MKLLFIFFLGLPARVSARVRGKRRSSDPEGQHLVSELKSAQCIPSGISAPMREGSSPCVRVRLLGIVPHGELWVGRHGL